MRNLRKWEYKMEVYMLRGKSRTEKGGKTRSKMKKIKTWDRKKKDMDEA